MRASTLIGTSGAVAATAGIGSVASAATQSRWYKKLDTPPYQPPPQVFPVVWTALYADIARSSASALSTGIRRRNRDEVAPASPNSRKAC